MKKKTQLGVTRAYSDKDSHPKEREELLYEFRTAEHRGGKRTAAGLCILLGLFALAVVILYVFLASTRTAGGMLVLPAEFPVIAIATAAVYALFCTLILVIVNRANLARFEKQRAENATDSSAIRLFKEEIDLPYVVTGADGKIIVANKAFESAAADKYTAVGDDIRDICTVALDKIIRTTAAESDTDQKISEVHAAAVSAYPRALNQATTADTCLTLLREINEITLSSDTASGDDPDSPLCRVHEIASGAFREAEKRSALWNLCLSTLESILTAHAPDGDEREKLTYIYDLAREAYRMALEQENEELRQNVLREFSASLRKIVSIAESDPTEGQLASAFRLRYEMFEGKNLLPHTRTLLLNIRRQLAEALPDPSVVTDDKDTVTLQAILRLTDEGIAALRAGHERSVGDREFCIGTLSSILRVSEAAGADSVSRAIHAIRGIADAALCALLPERADEYVTLVTDEILSATAEKRETSPTEDEIRAIAEDIRTAARSGNQTDEERFIASFRDAVRRIAEESRLGMEREGSEAARIRTIIEKEVSGSLSFLEIRTAGIASLSSLIKYGEETLTLRDLGKSDQKLVSMAVTRIGELKKELLAVTAVTPSAATALSHKIAKTLSDLLSKFDERADYTHKEGTAEDERSAQARTRIFYAEIEKTAALTFPLTADHLSDAFFDRASLALMGYRLYPSLILKSAEILDSLPPIREEVPAECLPEVSDRSYADGLWSHNAALLLLHIGVLRVYAAQHTVGLTELERVAEATFEKLTVRRILAEMLVATPVNAVSAADNEGADDKKLYEIASSYFRDATTHRGRLLFAACRTLIARVLAFLELADRLSLDTAGEEEREALTRLRTEAAHSRALLLTHGSASRPEEAVAECTAFLNACITILSPFAKAECAAGAFHASLVYLSEIFGDLNSHLLRRELFRTYRDTALEITARLHRAEYTGTSLREIRRISESVLSAGGDRAVTFSGLTIEECCSANLRTIAGLAGTDALKELSELADAHAGEALTAKALWELRNETMLAVKGRLDAAEQYSLFHDKKLIPHRAEITRLRKIAEDSLAIPHFRTRKNAKTSLPEQESIPLSPEEQGALIDEVLSLLSSIADPDDPDEVLEADSPEARFRAHIRRVFAASKRSFEDFLTAFTAFYAFLNAIGADTLSVRQNKKRFQMLRRSLKEEESISIVPETGAPLSRVSVYEIFSEYLDATLRAVRPTRDSNPPMDDIFHALSSMKERIEDDSSAYFRLFAASALSRTARTVRQNFSSELYARIMPPLAVFLAASAETVENSRECATQDSILRVCTAAFREVDALYRLGEIANESLKVLTRFAGGEIPGSNDCTRIYNTVTEICQKVETCLQTVPKSGNTHPLLRRLNRLSGKLRSENPNLDKAKYSGEGFTAMMDFLKSISDLTSPYLLLIDNKDAAAFRSEVSRTRRSVREVSEATALSGSRAIASAALSAIGQYAHTFDGEELSATVADDAISALSSIPEGINSPERIYALATEALARIIAKSASKPLRARAKAALLDLSERRTVYRFLVTIPIERLSAAFPDPTSEGIYPEAAAIYRRLEAVPNRFRAELILGMLRDELTSIRTLTDPGAVSRIRAICEVLEKSLAEFEAEIRALPLRESESFVPPSLRAKQKQLRSWLERLFEFSKRAVTESCEDPEKQRLADAVTLTVYQGITHFDEIAASKEEGAMNRLPEACRSIIDKTLSMLRAIEPAERYLEEIRSRVDALFPALTLPSPLDDSVTEEKYDAAFASLLRRARREISQIPESVARFREETEETAGGNPLGSTAVYRCETVAHSLLETLQPGMLEDASCSSDSLCRAVAGLLALRAQQHGAPTDTGITAVYDKKGRPSGQNNTALRLKKKADTFIPVKQNDESTYREHGLSVAQTAVSSGESVTLGGKRYIARSYPHRSGGKDYYLVTFTAVEEALTLKQACEDENTVVALITLDNLEELAQYVRIDYREAEKDVEKALRDWAGQIHGIFHEYERDKYILFFSQKEMANLVNSKFSDILTALEGIRLGDSSVSVTISMGISALGNTLTMKEQNASAALDIALKRGGAQIVIFRDADSQEDRYEFFSGNRVKGLQKENRVGARVVSNYLCELIRKSGDVLVMGHAYPDFDSIGSCVGIAALARYYKKDVHIVVNRQARNFTDCTPDLLTLPEYQNIFIDGTTGMELKGTDTLLVLCDVSNTNIMEYVDIARTSFNTVIIDHHFKTTDSDDLKTLLTYIDPSASSASELVAEILEEALPKDELRKEEANVLLSGIMVDTKNFTRSVGARTFAAALYLRQMGANAEISSTYFYEQNGDYKAEVVFRKNLEFHKEHKEVAITFCSPEDIRENPEVAGCDLRVAASKAADKLLTVRGVRASFALYPYSGGGKNGVAISGRSDGSVNVQEILETFHGGGHFDSAGANLPDRAVEEVITSLSAVIDDYFRDVERDEEEDDED